LSGANQECWDAAAFQAWSDEVAPDSEEERQQGIYDLRPHPQRDVVPTTWAVGDWRIETRSQEALWWVNHGPMEQEEGGESLGRAEGFRMCPNCGEMVKPLPPPPTEKPKRGRRVVRDPRADQDPHAKRCTGEPRSVALGHQTKADTLRLCVAGLEELGDDGVAWAWSVGTALLEGARKHFELDEDEVIVQTKKDSDRINRALEIIWVDKVLGGSGIIGAIINAFGTVAQAAVRHLEGHDCAISCYRCLRSYRNQRVHGLLNWRLALPYLKVAAVSELRPVAPSAVASPSGEGPEWDEARCEGCESPLELRLLKAIRAAGLPEPEKQHEIHDSRGGLITRADFAYLAPRCVFRRCE
jgi:hypothetical protein